MGKNLLAIAFAAMVTSIGGAAVAQQPAPAPAPSGRAIEFGARFAFGVGLGNVGRTATETADRKLADATSAILPLWLDLGFRINPHLYVGAFFQYAIGFINNDRNPQCSATGVSCSINDKRLGANVHYHFAPGEPFDPWLGLGVGYEWFGASMGQAGMSLDTTVTGFEFANFQLGGDFIASPSFHCGPFTSFSLGQFNSVSLSGAGQSGSTDITSKALHEWLLFGFKGAFSIGI
jgi:opacity protein-like surface antigen